MTIAFILAAIVIWVLAIKHLKEVDREVTRKFYKGDIK